MAQFRVESRMSFRSRHLRIETGLLVHWARPDRREVRAPADVVSELAGYTTAAELQDLHAMLDRYPDDETDELRSILAGQALRRLRTW